MMRDWIFPFFLYAVVLAFLTVALRAEDKIPRPWTLSVAAMSAATVADIVSTEMSNGYEVNPLIPTRSNGKPQPGVYVAKAGFIAGFAVLQYYVIKQHPRSKAAKVFSIVNFGIAGGTTAVAIHNWRVQ